MFQSTVHENLQDWDRFSRAYYQPVRAAFACLRFVDADEVDDLTQSFFLKMLEKQLLENRPVIQSRFRDWLYCLVKRHAIDHRRKLLRTHEPKTTDTDREVPDPDPHPGEAADGGDTLYALSLLQLAVQVVRKHWERQAKPEVWHIFEELVLAPLDPTRVPLTRPQLREMYPHPNPKYLDACATSVKRVFQRIVPELIPPGLSDQLSPQDRYQEWAELLRASGAWQQNRLHLAFLTLPRPTVDSLALSAAMVPGSEDLGIPEDHGDDLPEEMKLDELRVLFSFLLGLPFDSYLEDSPTPTRIASGIATPSGQPAACLDRLVEAAATEAHDLMIPRIDQILVRVKDLAKASRRRETVDKASEKANACPTMPAELAVLVYNLAAALSLRLCGKRIDSLSDDQLRMNLEWSSSRPWIPSTVADVFRIGLSTLEGKAPR